MKRAAVLALFASGCSWAVSRAPERGRSCTASIIPPAIDTFEAAGAAGLALASLAYVNEGHSDGDVVGLIGLISAGVGLVYAASAKHGFDRAAECRNADVAHLR
jgi:hypothetical protein